MQEAKYINFRKVRTFDEVLRTVFIFLRINLKPLFKSLIIICGPFFLGIGIVGGLFYGELLPMMLQFPRGPRNPSDLPSATFALYYFLMMIFLMGGVTMLITVVNAFISLYVDNGQAPTTDDVWKKTKSNILPMIGAGFLYMILSGIASFFFFIPGIYVSVALSILFIMRMQENIGLFEAISRSFSLIKGFWWQTAGILFILYILVTLISYAFAIPMGIIIAALATLSTPSSMFSFMPIVLPIISIIFIAPSLVLYALFPIAQALQYYNLVERKEAAGLREKIEGLQSPEEGWAQGGTL